MSRNRTVFTVADGFHGQSTPDLLCVENFFATIPDITYDRLGFKCQTCVLCQKTILGWAECGDAWQRDREGYTTRFTIVRDVLWYDRKATTAGENR